MDLRAQLRHNLPGIALNASVDVDAFEKVNLGIQDNEGLTRNGPAHIVVLCVAEYADDLHVGILLLALRHQAPDRVAAAQVLVHQCFIHQTKAARAAQSLQFRSRPALIGIPRAAK